MAASIQVFKYSDSTITMNASTMCLVKRSQQELRNQEKHGRRRWKKMNLYGQYNNRIEYKCRKGSSYHIAYNPSCTIPYLFPRKSIQALMDDSEQGSISDFDEATSTVTGSEHGTELCMEIGGVAPFTKSGTTAEDWRKSLSKVVPAVVVLKVTGCRAFDTDNAGTASATGFIIDKRRGIILTNRHVIKTGPIVADAIFVNREEIPLHPLYRDPVHDFGFFGFNPDSVKFLDYEEIPLAPDAASVGLEIRVVGNDSGEKISILAGTIARVDRDAPRYRTDGYNDFNTFYIQASSGTRGGSSGSPVIDSQGRAVAMNAGSKTSTATAFYLPLERVVRALEFLQKSRDSYKDNWQAISIPRGTLQVTFLHKGYDEMRRLGLQSETEQMIRYESAAEETGMLVVDSVVPSGPADEHLEQGDMLIRINGEVTTRFLKMETLLDDSVNQQIELLIERGGKPITMKLTVQDLHSITPDHFLEVSGGIIHPLSYQQARNFGFPCGLVYVAEPGYMLSRAGVPRFAIIKRLAGEEISVIKDLVSALAKLRRGERAPLEYITKGDRHLTKSVLIVVDRHDWYAPPCIHTRDDSTGLWKAKSAFHFQTKPQPLPSCPNQDQVADRTAPNSCKTTAMDVREDHATQDLIDGVENLKINNCVLSEEVKTQDLSDIVEKKRNLEASSSADNSLHSGEGTELKGKKVENGAPFDYGNETALSVSANASYAEHVIEPTLVTFQVYIPSTCMVDGVHLQNFSGTGVIVYHSTDIGLIAVDKNTVPVSVCDIILSFAAFPITIRGQVVFLHPVHNFALVAYDPSKMGARGASAVRAAQLLPELALRRGDSVYLVGLTKSLQLKSRKSIVTNTCSVLNIQSSIFPKYRAMNAEFIELETDFGSLFSGVLADEHGRVQALWGSFSSQKYTFARGIPVCTIKQVVEKIIYGVKGQPLLVNGVIRQIPPVRVLEVELNCRSLTKARSYGLSDQWIQALFKKDPIRKQVLRVKRCFGGSKAEKILEQDDMILRINNELVTCFRDVENACLALDDCDSNDGKMNMTVFRKGQEIDLVVGTDIQDGCGTTRVINWCGCIVQEPHSAVRSLGFLPKEGHGVYIARRHYGSPASRYGLVAVQWIVEVNGNPTPDLDAFVDVIKDLDHGHFYRLKTVTLSGRTRVLSLKQDLHYWPTWELRFDPETAIWHRQVVIKSL